jgi:uncharacterized membrane protein YukC
MKINGLMKGKTIEEIIKEYNQRLQKRLREKIKKKNEDEENGWKMIEKKEDEDYESRLNLKF